MKYTPVFALILSSWCLGLSTFAADSRPNILFLFSDDQSYKTLSCYPEALPGVNTPHLDLSLIHI